MTGGLRNDSASSYGGNPAGVMQGNNFQFNLREPCGSFGLPPQQNASYPTGIGPGSAPGPTYPSEGRHKFVHWSRRGVDGINLFEVSMPTAMQLQARLDEQQQAIEVLTNQLDVERAARFRAEKGRRARHHLRLPSSILVSW